MRLLGLEWAGAFRRWWLHAAVSCVLVCAGLLTIRSLSRPRWIRQVPLELCLVNWKQCQGDDVRIVGAYVPQSLRETEDCPAQLTLQSPGGLPGGKLEVCSRVPRGTLHREEPCDGPDDWQMPLVVANGYYSLSVKGRLEGPMLEAEEVMGGGCESSYYAWRYGDDAVRMRD